MNKRITIFILTFIVIIASLFSGCGNSNDEDKSSALESSYSDTNNNDKSEKVNPGVNEEIVEYE